MVQSTHDARQASDFTGTAGSDVEPISREEPARMYSHALADRSERHGDVWRNYQIAYDINDLVAGVLFVVGSLLFFDTDTETVACTLFLIGSVSFCVRPLIHVLRDLHLTRLPE